MSNINTGYIEICYRVHCRRM